MIKKTLIFFLIIFIVNILVRDVYKPNIYISQSMWQQNQISAQDYIYTDTDSIENIIVGSSMAMSGRLIMDSLDGYKFRNLAFPAEDSKEGLRLIIDKGTFPKRVFIEINVILRNDDTGFYDILYNPILYPVRKEIPAFRDGKQPIPLLTTLVHKYITENIIPKRIEISKVVEENKKKTANIGSPSLSSQYNIIKYPLRTKHLLSWDELTAFSQFKNYIKVLEENGVEIIFFEMPYNGAYCPSEKIPAYRQIMTESFPSDRYIYIPNPKCGTFSTSDGVHLEGEEAMRYTHYFKTQVDSLYKIRK